MKTKVILSLTISFFLFFIITSTLTKPVIASETIALPASAITDGSYPALQVGHDGGDEYISAVKFLGIDPDQAITSAYLQMTGLKGNETLIDGSERFLNVSVSSNDDWGDGNPIPEFISDQFVNEPIGDPIELISEEIATYSIDVTRLLKVWSNIGPDKTISFVLSSNYQPSIWFAGNDLPEYAPKLVIEYGAPLDEDPPVFTGGTPTISNVTSNSATLRAQLNEPGTVYYVLVVSESQAPSNEQVKAGLQETGEPALSGSFNVTTASTDVDYIIPGLIGNTAYDLYVVAEDRKS